MAHYMMILFISSIIYMAALQETHAVEYTVTNRAETTPGGIRFTNEIGIDYTKQTSDSATTFIWQTFQQNTPADRKNVDRVSLFIDDSLFIDGKEVVAYTSNNEIHISAKYIESKEAITGVIYHEMAHIWQWNGNGGAPGGLVEGIADYVRLKAGFVPSHWVKPGQGDRWDQGYDVTARFLDYCNSLRNGFVAELNNKLKDGYSANFFVDLLGKTVDQLWSEYKAANNAK